MAFSLYNRLLMERPVITKSVTTGTLFAVGDLLSQLIENRTTPKDYSYRRTATMGSFGLFFAGPALHNWYVNVLGKALPTPGLKYTAAKIAIDQTAFTAAFISTFYYYMSRMEGNSHEAGVAKIKKDLWPTIQANWLLWIPVQLANFSIIPLPYQVLVVNFTGLIWNTYLSYKSNIR